MADNSHPGLGCYAAALQVHLQLLLTRPGKNSQLKAEVLSWAETQQLNFRGQSTYDWEMREKLICARVLCRQYVAHPGMRLKTRLQEVLSFIEGQIPALAELDWQGVLVEVNIIIALILHNLERKAETLTAMEEALALAEPQGYRRILLDEGQPMRELLQLALTEGIHKDYARELLIAFDGKTLSSLSSTHQQPRALVDPLSVREMQVLRLLNTRLSVPEIAEEIHLSPTTVRTHVQHIYGKLGVHGRIEAIQRSEEIGLL